MSITSNAVLFGGKLNSYGFAGTTSVSEKEDLVEVMVAVSDQRNE